MRKGKLIFLVIISLAMAFTAAIFANKIISNSQKQNANNEANTVNIVIADKKIPYGKKIEKANLTTKSVNKAIASESMFTDIKQVTGRIALTDIFNGEIIIKERIGDGTKSALLAALISKSKRAVSVRVNDVIGVAGFLQPGNKVDVLSSRIENKRAHTKTVLQNIKVLAVDQMATPNEDEPVVVRAVTLEVGALQSEKLFKAMQEGSIQLTLRNPFDQSIISTKKNNIEITKKPSKKTKKSPEYVTVIRGTQVSEEVL